MADADQAAGHIALGFVDPLLYKLAAESSSPYLTAGSIYDELAAGKQAIERNDYLLPAASEYPYTTVRVLGYEGLEEYCSGTEECEVQNVELHATPGFDSMTGIGSPGPEFLRFAATLKPRRRRTAEQLTTQAKGRGGRIPAAALPPSGARGEARLAQGPPATRASAARRLPGSSAPSSRRSRRTGGRSRAARAQPG